MALTSNTSVEMGNLNFIKCDDSFMQVCNLIGWHYPQVGSSSMLSLDCPFLAQDFWQFLLRQYCVGDKFCNFKGNFFANLSAEERFS